MTQAATLAIYNKIGWVALFVSVIVLALSPIVKRWMHLDTLTDREDGLIDIEGQSQAGIEAQEGGMHPAVRPER
jgi:POT family proton-dependent oligopeptide transporter